MSDEILPTHPNRDAHMAYLQRNLGTIMERSIQCYGKYGRGLWLLKGDDEADMTEGVYITDFSGLPQDSLTERLRGMVAKYDPSIQAVVLIKDDDGEHAYTIGSRETLRQVATQTGRGKSHERAVPERTITMPANREAAIARLRAMEGDHSSDAEWERAAIIHTYLKENNG